MKKIFLFAATVAMAYSFTSCDKCDDCATVPAPPASVEAATPAEVQDALNQGVPNVTLTEPLEADAAFTVPNSFQPNQQLTLTLPASENNDVTINQGTGGAGTLPALNLNIPSVDNLTINTPDMSATFDGSVDGTLTASTAANTLTIAKDAVVATLVVNKGNVYVFGTVTNYSTIAAGSKIVRAVSTGTELVNMLKGTESYNNGVVLTADIHGVISTDINAAFTIGLESVKVVDKTAFDATQYDGYIFDGNGFTLGGAGMRNVLLVCANEAVIKNLKIQQNTAEKAAAVTASNGNNGMTVYRSKNVVIDNVTVASTDKAGVVISSSTVRATKLNTENNKWGGVNVTEGITPQYGGKPEFTLVSGNLAEVDNAQHTGPYKVWVDLNTLSVSTNYSVSFLNGVWESALNATNQRYYYPKN